MIITLSPSKSMNMEPAKNADFTQAVFLDRSQKLISKARKFSKTELMEFMDISEKLAELNRQRFKEWKPPFTLDNAKQAVLAFTGDVYDGLDAVTLKKRDLTFAQNHLRILSGLYGLLKPMDLIQPYRLEMGRPLETRGAKNLYEFWKATVTEELNSTKGDVLINLASNEYFKAIDKRALDKEIVSPVFKDEKNGKYKIISFFAKKARGTMARYIIENRLQHADDLQGFNEGGYSYNTELSSPAEPVFTRPEAKA
ncbi:peroxide stress protein YaaA [Pontiellaceae bacterium B12227]|nr:peroxide stress protein YaaA [Pontiellaceae bacterium B12227]